MNEQTEKKKPLPCTVSFLKHILEICWEWPVTLKSVHTEKQNHTVLGEIPFSMKTNAYLYPKS